MAKPKCRHCKQTVEGDLPAGVGVPEPAYEIADESYNPASGVSVSVGKVWIVACGRCNSYMKIGKPMGLAAPAKKRG